MDVPHQAIQTTSLQKFTKFILTIYMFSFLFSYSSWSSFLLNSFKHSNLYVFPYQLVAHTLDKNMIFLICNGILMFIAKTSGLLCSRSTFDINDFSCVKKVEDRQETQSKQTNEEFVLENQVLRESTNTNSPPQVKLVDKEDTERNENTCVAEYDGENDKELKSCFAFDDGEEGENKDEDENGEEKEKEKGEPLGSLSTEELNKKFDEFIRKMKEELRIQAQQQLIMV